MSDLAGQARGSRQTTPDPKVTPSGLVGSDKNPNPGAAHASASAAADVASLAKAKTRSSESGSGSGSSSSIASASITPPAQPPRAIPRGLRPFLYLGIPESVLRWKPKPPSRNTSIFLAVSTTLVSLYVYDRRECKRIRQEYIDQVSHLAEQPLAPYEYPRKIHVYGAKSPGDDDYEKSIVYFRRYVRPILKAGGIDWETLNGMRHGGLGREVRERIFARRRQLLGLEPWGTSPSTPGGPIGPPAPNSLEAQRIQGEQALQFAIDPQTQMQRELDGAVVVVGRPAYKEYMWGLKQGWTSKLPPQREDLDESLAAELQDDGKFDEVVSEIKPDGDRNDNDSTAASTSTDKRPLEELDEIERRNRLLAESAGEDEGAPLPSSRVSTSPLINKSQSSASPSARPAPPSIAASLLEPPTQIPAQPPFIYVPFTNLTGWRQVPQRMINFFNRRRDVRLGGDAALSILLGDKSTARDFLAPVVSSESDQAPPQGGDLDWGLSTETRYPPRFHNLPQTIESARQQYYKDLPRALQDSRSYYRGQRELTATEKNSPPKTEAALRDERLRKEREWRNELQGWSVLDVRRGVEWDERFRGSLRVCEEDGQRVRREGEEREQQQQ